MNGELASFYGCSYSMAYFTVENSSARTFDEEFCAVSACRLLNWIDGVSDKSVGSSMFAVECLRLCASSWKLFGPIVLRTRCRCPLGLAMGDTGIKGSGSSPVGLYMAETGRLVWL